MTEPAKPIPDPSPELRKLNVDIAERVRQLNSEDLVSVLSGRASSLIAADDNQNQNQGRSAL